MVLFAVLVGVRAGAHHLRQERGQKAMVKLLRASLYEQSQLIAQIKKSLAAGLHQAAEETPGAPALCELPQPCRLRTSSNDTITRRTKDTQANFNNVGKSY